MLVFAAYFAVFMEWLFYVTKPSFMGAMSFPEKLAILAIASLAAAAPGLALIAVLWILNLAPLGPRAWKVFLFAGAVIPTAYLAAAFLLLIDNFTYTVFHFGVLTSQGSQRGMYAVLLGVLWLVSIWWIIRGLSHRARQKRFNPALRAELGLCAVLLVLSVIIGWTLFQAPRASVQVPIGSGSAARPNILLIGSDGLDADHMSLYNDQVSTTPFLKAFSQTALLSENNFPNANETAGSLVSIFTGRLPTATRTLYPPDILQGADAFQHFPEILKSAGYYNAELSVDYYADMTNLNMQDSFVTINGRSNTLGSLYTLTREVIPEDAAYFLSTVAKGLSDRVEQMLYIHTVSNPYSEVTLPMADLNDQNRVDSLIDLFETVHQPLFVHVHMMGTHLPTWDSYDQAVQAFDGYMQEVIGGLERMNQLDNTMIILYTDHGFTDVTNVRIPLMIRLPDGAHAGVIMHNTQNLDIAPTILDYLGIKPPSWMIGQSLLQGEPASTRPIFSAAPNYIMANQKNELQLDPSKIGPPFYQFGTIGMVICQNVYTLETASLKWTQSQVQGYPNPCPAGSLPGDRQAQDILLAQLRADGFQVGPLEAALAPPAAQ